MTRLRFLTMLAVALAAVGVCVAVAGAAKVQPKTGHYGGTVGPGGGEGAGFFDVKQAGGKLEIVPVKGWPIMAPTDFICKTGDITASNVVKPKSIPIKGGSFDYSGTPVGSGQAGRTIEFHGDWKNPKTITGYTKTTGGGCNHKVTWMMTTPPPKNYGGP